MAVISTSRPPKRGAPPSAACGGFTLLEILVAIFIFAIVVTTIFGSFNSVFSKGEELQTDVAVYEMARRCLSRMTADLAQIYVAQRPAYVPPATSDEEDPYQVLGEEVLRGSAGFARLRFASRAHLPMGAPPGGGVARIVYYPDEAADGSLVLRRSDQPDPAPDFEESPADPIVCENLRAMTCTFFDEDGNPHEGWDSDAAEHGFGTPVGVGIKLEIGDDQRAAVFETRVALPVFREQSK